MYGPDTVTWRVNREVALLAGGGRALLLQVGHPKVGAGVEQHSNYEKDPFGRLFRTLDITTKIVFGDPETSEQASARLTRRHKYVNGQTEDGEPYDARDPELLTWVWATLVDTALLIHDRLLKPLSESQKATYYEEQKRFLEACGAPAETAPGTWQDFRAYFDRMVEGELAATPAAKAVWRSIERPSVVPRPLLPVFWPNGLITAGLLPESLREAFGFPWTPARRRALDAALAAGRTAIPLLPSPVRHFPEYRRARTRWKQAA